MKKDVWRGRANKSHLGKPAHLGRRVRRGRVFSKADGGLFYLALRPVFVSRCKRSHLIATDPHAMVLALKSLHVVLEGARIIRVEIDNQILEEIVVGIFVADGDVWKGGNRVSGPQCQLV